MACRVGMSTDPRERIRLWLGEEGHEGAEILASGLTYDQAAQREEQEARARGCRRSPGGQRNNQANWSVYHVWGGG